MRFASKSQRYKREVRKPVFALIQGANGPEKVATRENNIAEFRQAGLTPHEREQVLARFTFNGLAEGEDAMRRVSIYDTDQEAADQGWDAETKAAIEQNLIEGQNEWYFLLEEKKAAKPWPTYDSQTPKQILDTLAATGAEVEGVLLYERENKNRSTLISELEAQTAAEEESEPLVAA